MGAAPFGDLVVKGEAVAGKNVVILGGGFGGISAALELRRGLDTEHRITLVDRRGIFFMGLRHLSALVGRGTLAEGTRPLRQLAADGVEVRTSTVNAIDVQARTVRLDDDTIAFDYLIVAVGAEPRPDLVPGFSDEAFNLYDPLDVERLAARLPTFTAGRVHIAVFGVPYKCPPAPYEAAMLLDAYFTNRGLRAGIALETSTPQPMSLPVVGAAGCANLEGMLAAKNIAFTPNRKVVRLEGANVVTENGPVAADLLIGVPPHRPPAVVRESGLELRGEWIAVDATTMRTSVEGIYAVGDVTEIPLANGMALPKAGVFAEEEGKVTAAAIIAEITGGQAPAGFQGKGYCFIETGDRQAALVQGEFLAAPAPRVEMVAPSADTYRQKVEFESSRLSSWFR